MTDHHDVPISPPPHAVHDRTLIAALAARPSDLAADEADAARTLVADCADCRDLLADLTSLAAAVPTAAIPVRPREFTLTAADAARLRPSGWRRWLGAVGSARDGITRPLAMGLTTIGLAGLLVATLPSAFSGASGGAASGTLSTVGSAIGGAVTAAPAAPAEGPTRTDDMQFAPATTDPEPDGGLFSGAGDAATERQGNADPGTLALESIRDDRTGLSVLLVVGGAMLILGLGLFALRWTARRFGDS